MTDFDNDSRTAWISQGFERLVDHVRTNPTDVHFDVLIIGSGYGGAMAAAVLAGRTVGTDTARIAVLERGNEYLPGAFPTGLGELAKHVRRDGNRQGLFDIRLGPEVNTVIANGVGGGSLINAGVMETPKPGVFQNGWPVEVSDLATLNPFYTRAMKKLGAHVDGAPNKIDNHPDGVPLKHQALEDIAPHATFRSAAITVAMKDRVNSAGVKLKKCLQCGDCATGCNFGAKESLDLSLLAKAHQAGAKIFSGATVLFVSKDDTSWVVNTVYTDKNLRLRDGAVVKIRADKVILAAGTLGSNEILERSSEGGLAVSAKNIGQGCSTNGDMLAVDFATDTVVNNVADESVRPSQRAIGPTITGIIDLRDDKGVLIEEISVPASLRLAFNEVFGFVNALQGLQDIDWSSHSDGFPTDDGYAVPPQHIKTTAAFAIMGDDGAQGSIKFKDNWNNTKVDGTAFMSWPTDPEPEIFEKEIAELSKLTAGTGGRLIANPAWRPLPKDMDFLVGDQTGPVTTVHPLGGLNMAENGTHGVVNHLGQVFRSETSNSVYDDLVVLDGSIVPTALGTNPALTIAALALRAAEELAEQWSFGSKPDVAADTQPFERPVFRETDRAASPQPTEVEVIERLSGPVELAPAGGSPDQYIAELTLRFKPKPVQDLNPGAQGDCTLVLSEDELDPLTRSEIRIFRKDDWEPLSKTWSPPMWRERELDAIAILRAPLTGYLKVLERESSWPTGRIWRAGKAWLLNRGLRDIYQATFEDHTGGSGPGLLSRIKSGIAIASKAGEVRKLVYRLRIGPAVSGSEIQLGGNRIRGVKRFTYNRRGNPWRQLMDVTLEDFPGLNRRGPRVLNLDMAYLARIGVPLFRITKQSDAMTAISDITGFVGYFLRLLLGIHIWSFRAPDTNDDGKVIKFAPPDKLRLSDGTTVNADAFCDGGQIGAEVPDLDKSLGPIEGKVRITRYPNPNATRPPVVMFHGYSAGGTTFAHHAVNPNFASHLWESGREVLIADLRTSPYFRETTATVPWSFDQIAANDVHYVINKAIEATGAQQVDVVAHCMGTVVCSMAILDSASNELFKKIRRVAFTQVGPLVVFSPVNILRGYIMKYLVGLLPDNYQFRPDTRSLTDDILDRVLATLPYPVDEFDIENPVIPWKRTPWTRTRHRMDALYGRDFNAARMDPGVLEFIDEHFGALSIRTVSSTLHYARNDMMTDFRGRNKWVSRENFGTTWSEIPTFSLHGGENGLSDPVTVNRMEKILHDAGVHYLKPEIVDEAGHQDALIGADRLATFEHIRTFLDLDLPTHEGERNTDKVAHPPWIGPVMTLETPETETTPGYFARIGAAPSHRKPESIVLLRVQIAGDRILRPDTQSDDWAEDYVLLSMVVYPAQEFASDGWAVFEVPKPEFMPGFDSEKPGNATLVLIVYDEADELAPAAGSQYFFARRNNNGQNEVFKFGRDGKYTRATPEEFDLERFVNTRKAVSKSLLRGASLTRPADGTHSSGIVLRGRRDVNRVAVDPSADTGMREVPVSELQFASNQAIGEAVFDQLQDQDDILLDGVIPDWELPDGNEQTRFMFGSCQYPAGLLDKPVAYNSYGTLAGRLTSPAAPPRFSLLVGDQVYVDATAGLFDPRDINDRYRSPYENWLRAPAVRKALRSAPSYMLLDDHEIVDNWEPRAGVNDKQSDWFKEAISAYRKYQHGLHSNRQDFEHGNARFFLLNTRTCRTRRAVGDLMNAELAHGPAMTKLKDWMEQGSGVKFVVTPSMFLPRHRRAIQRDTRLHPDNLSAIHSDGWDGYLASMREILGHIAKKQIKNIVFLSGDEHRACLATGEILNAQDQQVTRFASVHTSALWAPFPFANSLEEDTADLETFTFDLAGGQFSCVVKTERPVAGDGPTFVSVRELGNEWFVDCEFSDGETRTITC
ncbi:alpha/beta fold hydrolase [Ruegeria hyattellae]|uniref:alpha/beta fold hydrolase n=1 Tax=Ruegeria hyattellae TaxID=3233337 RepID=UPI00355C41C9